MADEKKKTETSAAPRHRKVTVRFRGGEYPALADGKTLVGLLCAQPRGNPREWAKAVEDALGK